MARSLLPNRSVRRRRSIPPEDNPGLRRGTEVTFMFSTGPIGEADRSFGSSFGEHPKRFLQNYKRSLSVATSVVARGCETPRASRIPRSFAIDAE